MAIVLIVSILMSMLVGDASMVLPEDAVCELRAIIERVNHDASQFINDHI